MIVTGSSHHTLFCSRCGAAFSNSVLAVSNAALCGSCGASFDVEVFPAFFRGPGFEGPGEALKTDDEAGCFYHPTKRAVMVCDSCGRFLCSLCHLGLGTRNLCPSCVELGRGRKEVAELVTSRTLYDEIALALATYPILLIITTVLTAPAAIYFSVRHWNSPSSLVPRTKLRFILAILLSLMQVAGWGLVFLGLLR